MRTLIIGSPGIVSAAYCIFNGFRFEEVYYITNPKRAGWARAIKRVCPKAKALNAALFKGASSEINRMVIRYTEEALARLAGDPAISLLSGFAGNDKIFLAVKKHFLFDRAMPLCESLVLVKRLADVKGRVSYLPPDGAAAKFIYERTNPDKVAMAAGLFLRAASLSGCVFMPVAAYVLAVFGAFFTKGLSFKDDGVRGAYRIAVPVTHGFSPKMPWKDDFIFASGKIAPRDVLFVKESWKVDEESRKAITVMGAGYAEFDRTAVMVPYFFKRMLLEYGKLCLRLFLVFAFRPGRFENTAKSIIAPSISLLNSEIFFSRHPVKVYFIKDEYSPASITKTIAIHGIKGRTVGIMHSDYNHPYISPGLTMYLYLDYYCIYGDAYAELYKPYWEGVANIRPIGILRNDRLFMDAGTAVRNEYCRGLLGRKNGRYLVSVFVPTMRKNYDADNPMTGFIRKFYMDILAGVNENPGAMFVIKRRSDDDIFNDPDIGAALADSVLRGRIEFAPSDATYDLIRISDLIIGWRNTGVCLESICAGKDAFYYNPVYDYIDPAFNVYKEYDDALVAESGERMRATLARFIKGEKLIRGDAIERIRRHHGTAFDGRSGERLGNVIKEALEA